MALKHIILLFIFLLAFTRVKGQMEAVICDPETIEQLIFSAQYQEAENCALGLLETKLSDELRATILTTLGEAMMNQSRDGHIYLEEALQLEFSKGLDSLLMAKTYLMLSKNAANLGRFDLGMEYNRQSIAIRKNLLGSNHWLLADNHNMFGYCNRFTSKYDLALANYEEAARIWEQYDGELRTSMGPTYDGLGIINSVLCRPTVSLENLDHSLQFKKQLLGTKIHPSISNTLQHIGRNYYDLHQYNQALEIFKEVLEIRKQTLGEEHVNVGVAYGLLADCHDRLGNYDLAIDLNKREISIFKKFLPTDYLLTPYTDLAGSYKKNGQTKEYLETLAKSEAVINASDRFGGQYLINNYLLKASHFKAIGDESSRLILLEKCSKIVDEKLSQLAGQRANIDFHLGEYYLDHKSFQKAYELFDRALKRKAGFYGSESPILHKNYLVLGDLHHQKGQFTKAIDYYQKSLELQVIDKVTNADAIPEVSNLLVPIEGLISISKIASSYFARYRHDTQLDVAKRSSDYFLAALKYLHFLRNSYQSDEAKIRISDLFSEVSAEALDLVFELYDKTNSTEWLEKAFWISEMRRSQVVVEAINEGNLRSLAKVPDSLLNKEITCYGELAYLRQKLGATKLKDQARNDLEKRLFQKSQELDRLKSEIHLYFPEYHRIRYEISSLKIQDIQLTLKKNEVLLAYSITNQNIYRFQIRKHQTEFDQVQKPNDWSRLLQNHHISITNYDYIINQAKEADSLFQQSARRLFNLLIPAPLASLNNTPLITIVPHDSLHNVQFGLLLTGEVQEHLKFRTYPYLIKKGSIRYAPSVSTLLTSKHSKDQFSEDYIGFAAPQMKAEIASSEFGLAIPGAQEEIAAVGQLFKGKTYIGSLATEGTFRKEASNFRVIHLAMHGTVDQEAPLNSKLHFSVREDSLNDGTLYLDEIYGIPLNAELAVLSACDTGDGKLSKGEGLMSMARAFNYAGCRSVLMSQWKVADDESTQLVIDFFRELKKGHSKSMALRNAQLTYLQEMPGNMRTHPFFWAGFRLMGDNQDLASQNESLGEWLVILTFLGLVFIVLFARKRR